MLCVPRKIPSGVSPLETYQSTLILEGHKLWEQKPTTFVTVYDHEKALELVKQGKLSQFDFMRHFGDASEFQVLNAKLLQGYDILAKILGMNSCRRQQDCKWKVRSFVRARYPFKFGEGYFREADTLLKYTEDGFWKGPLAPFELMNDIMTEKRKTGVTPLSQEEQDAVGAMMATYNCVCACCGKMTDCKMCTGCNSVYYCSRRCQKKAWPQHKQQCNK